MGRTLDGKYRLDALVGIVGMGAVYSAHHLALDRRVALKILQPNIALGDERLLELFAREARTAAQLSHENIAVTMDAGRTAENIAYIAMEWLEGQMLEEEIARQGQFSLARVTELLRQIAAALDAAHAARIIHRDLKSSNIMLVRRPGGPEQVKVLDFGIAKVVSDTSLSPVSAVMGTPHYASPEQLIPGGHIDGRADIYSLGIILYQMLTGELPFNATSIRELVLLQLHASPQPLRKLRPDAPPDVEDLIGYMLAKNSARRPPRARDIPDLFEGALRGHSGIAANGQTRGPDTPGRTAASTDESGTPGHLFDSALFAPTLAKPQASSPARPDTQALPVADVPWRRPRAVDPQTGGRESEQARRGVARGGQISGSLLKPRRRPCAIGVRERGGWHRPVTEDAREGDLHVIPAPGHLLAAVGVRRASHAAGDGVGRQRRSLQP